TNPEGPTMPISFATATAGLVLAVGAVTGTETSCDSPTAGPAKPASVDWPVAPKPVARVDTGNAGSGYACEPGWVCGTCPPDSKYGVHEWGYDPVEVDRLHIPHDHPCG